MEYGSESVIEVEYRGRVAVLTINKPQKLGALARPQYYELSKKLREVASRDEVFVTVLVGKGRFFSAGADVGAPRPSPLEVPDLYKTQLTSFAANNLNLCHAFSTHPKVLVVGLNGPVVGMSAALVAHADFIYCAPHTYLQTPFSSLGLVAEGGSSQAFAQRMGIAKANEALIMGRRIGAQDLEKCGFVNGILTATQEHDGAFREVLLDEIDSWLGPHLIGESMLGIKRLIKSPGQGSMDSHNVAEVFAGLDRFMTGVPQAQFRKVARGEMKHKL